jgi:Ca2+-binding RTX toxin-like protein
MQYSQGQIEQLLRQAGFPESAIPTMVKIAQLESTNNTRAFNGKGRDLSYGLFQINMKDDDPRNPKMGEQRRKWFGLKSNEELYDPLTNAKAAYKLWNSKEKQGKNEGFTHWSTYNEQIAGNLNLRNINKGAQGMEASATTGAGFENEGESFALTAAMIDRAFLTDKEIGKIFQDFKGQQGPEAEKALKAALQQTKFWQKFSTDVKQEIYSSLLLDPASYQEKFKLRLDEIKNKFLTIGAPVPSNLELQDLAKKTLLFGLKGTQLDEIVFNSVKFDNNFIAGKAGEYATSIYKSIEDFGGTVDKTSSEFKNYVFDAIRTGGASVDQVRKQYADLAAQMYPQFADRFKSGATLREVASPYLQLATQYLEEPITDLKSPIIQSGLVNGMNALDYVKEVKKNPKWQYTYNATESILGSLKSVLTDFGFGFGGK